MSFKPTGLRQTPVNLPVCPWCQFAIHEGQDTATYQRGLFHAGCLDDFYKSWEQEEHGK